MVAEGAPRRAGQPGTGFVAERAADGAGAAPGSPYFAASDLNTSLVTPFSVSSTPTPFTATASKNGKPRGFMRSFRISMGSAFGRSRLLYWRTIGISSGSISLASRFSRRFSKLSRSASSIASWLSATNTTQSAPFSTMRRVAL